MQLRKAERKKTKIRAGLSGPSGAGKTLSALLLAYGITSDWNKIAIIDSENGSGELYVGTKTQDIIVGEYNAIVLDAPYTPERYVEAIKSCEDAGMDVIIIDSTSHEWEGRGGCLELNDKLASAKFKGNTWAAWSETTPRHQKFIEAIVTSRCHIITTARSKTDTIQTEDKKIKKVGTKEIQREGFEYELTVNFNIDREHHLAMASKDRTGLFIDRDPFLITPQIGKEIMDWSQSGIDAEAREAELKAQEEAERIEREAREAEQRDGLYNSIINSMKVVKFIDDLATLWNTQVQPNKVLLGETYILDLTERKNAIKEQLTKTPPTDVVEPPKAPEAPVEKKVVEPTLPPEKKVEVEPIKDPVIQEPAAIADTISTFNGFIAQIKATTNIDELNTVWLEVDTALASELINPTQHGVLGSHKGIMLKKFPNQQ